MRVSLHCGRLDWREHWDELESWQLDEWMEFNRVESFGDERADERFAFLFASLAQWFGGDVQPADLRYLDRDNKAATVTVESSKANIRKAMGG